MSNVQPFAGGGGGDGGEDGSVIDRVPGENGAGSLSAGVLTSLLLVGVAMIGRQP